MRTDIHKSTSDENRDKRDIEMFGPSAQTGLTISQVEIRKARGLTNRVTITPSRTVWQILRANVFTLFNLINVCLAAALFAVGSYRNTMFLGVIVLNTFIGVFQETRSKKAVEKLSLMAQSRALAIRDGQEVSVAIDDIVLEDVLIFKPGMQICADCEVLAGDIEANESLLTGESDPVIKRKGDALKSGSFVVSGMCRALAVNVGDESYAAKLAASARTFKQPTSRIMTTLNRIVKTIGIVIVPLGAALFFRQRGAGLEIAGAVTGSAAAMIGMIPQGLVLLTSVALAAGAYNLAAKNVLISELPAIESLARVDVLCLDKTGTITTGEVAVEDIVCLGGTRDELVEAIRVIVRSTEADNATGKALREKFGGECACDIVARKPFSSQRKWSAALSSDGRTVFAGAPERLADGSAYEAVAEYAKQGLRVIAIADMETEAIPDAPDKGKLRTLGLALMSDTVRPNAPTTLAYFEQQGVEIKIISGDNPVTVSAVAARAGVKNADRFVDMTGIVGESELYEAARKYTVFSRVTPDQKMGLVKALKKDGHTVGMTGDGVNDVLALKEADCSIAMASGSDAAKQVANVTLMDDDFGHMPSVVLEGRRVTNNVQNAASLFLTKTVFSSALALFTLIMGAGYPLQPIQLTLFSTLFIGYPSFVLALQPNSRRIKGDFLKNVLSHALPGGIAIALGVFAILFVCDVRGIAAGKIGAMALGCTAGVGLMALIGVCRPFNALRTALVVSSVAAFAVCVTFFRGFFDLEALGIEEAVIVAASVAAAIAIMYICDLLIKKAGWARE